MIAIQTGVRWQCIVILSCISLTINDIEQIFAQTLKRVSFFVKLRNLTKPCLDMGHVGPNSQTHPQVKLLPPLSLGSVFLSYNFQYFACPLSLLVLFPGTPIMYMLNFLCLTSVFVHFKSFYLLIVLFINLSSTFYFFVYLSLHFLQFIVHLLVFPSNYLWTLTSFLCFSNSVFFYCLSLVLVFLFHTTCQCPLFYFE